MTDRTPLDRQTIVRAALDLLNREGVEGLTLRRLATELRVQAPALYWHFAGKQALLDEMATEVFREGFNRLGLPATDLSLEDWCRHFACSERQMLLRYRDGARLFSGTYLTDPSMFAPMEASLQKLTREGLSLASALHALSTLHCYVVGFTIEEQAVWPQPGQRDTRYAPQERSARLDADKFPLSVAAGASLFESPSPRFEIGLEIILSGIRLLAAGKTNQSVALTP
jgi:AcrR family transcriptional regulator